MAKKPDRPLGHVEFANDGTVRKVVEHPPREQSALESWVVEKFLPTINFRATAAAQFVLDPAPAPEPGDAVIGSASVNVLLQVVEAVDVIASRLNELRKSYLEALRARPELIDMVAHGYEILVSDSGAEPLLPKVSTKEGRFSVEAIAEAASRALARMLAEPTRQCAAEKITVSTAQVRIQVMMIRRSKGSLDWVWQRLVDGQHVLAAVKGKIEKHYDKPVTRAFWLVVYATEKPLIDDGDPSGDAPEITAIRQLLSASPHPFDRVLYFFPMARSERGHILDLWPHETRHD